MVGTMTRALVVSQPAATTAAVRFRPGGAVAFLGVAAHELTDRNVSARDVGLHWLSPRVLEAEQPALAVQELERSLLLASDAVAVISDGFLPALEQLEIPAAKIYVIENWAPIDELPLRPRANEWARQQGLVDKRVVLYSGTLGLKHDPQAIVQLARHLSDQDELELHTAEQHGQAAHGLSA